MATKKTLIGNVKGPKGDTGAKGDTGPQGLTGPTGATGATGATGKTGQRGSRWTAGTAITGTSTTATVFSGTGIADALVNDMYLNTSTGNTYRCTVAGNANTAKWVYAGNIKGATGDTGATGPQGPTGAAGATGPQGPKGDKGDTGATGPQGPVGPMPALINNFMTTEEGLGAADAKTVADLYSQNMSLTNSIDALNASLNATEVLSTTASSGITNYSMIRRYGNLYILQILIAAQSSGKKGDVLLTLPAAPTAFSAAPLVPYDDGSTSGSVQIVVSGKNIIANTAYKNKTYQGTAFLFF